MPCKLTVLCENSVALPHGLIGEHGWAIHLQTTTHNILLDTGQGLGLINNSRILGIDLATIDALVLSHGHYDHASGLPDLLNICGKKDVYLHPDAFVDRYWIKDGQCREIGIRHKKGYLESLGAHFKFVNEFTEIFPNVYISGEIPRSNDFEPPDGSMKIQDTQGNLQQDALRDDLSLVIDTEKGLTVVLGCAHAGLINILTHIQKMLPNRPIYMVIGGTHLGFADNRQFEATITVLNQFGVQKLGASHCTGLVNCAKLQQIYKDRFFFAAAGTRWEC